MSDSVEYAKSELARITKDGDRLQDVINKNILDIVELFSSQGHSEFTAGYSMSILERLLRFKPITPLTGEDDEWADVSHEMGQKHFQNKRCSSVFKTVDEKGNMIEAYDIDAIAYSDNGGLTWYTSSCFLKNVTFPYEPPTHPEKIYIEYTEDVPLGWSGDKYEIITDDKERIEALRAKMQKKFEEKEN
nr:MAG TPA: hypothetical protein [Caudoviricetes sp.]